jgi:hypothetical protein
MKKLVALVSGIRLNAVLCCGAALLLSACGAGVSDPVNGPPSQAAAELASGTARPAANNVPATPYGADAAPAMADAAAVVPAVTSAAAPAAAPAAKPAPSAARAAGAAANIEPAYDSNRQAARTAGFSDQAETPVEVAQEAAPACDAAGCQH